MVSSRIAMPVSHGHHDTTLQHPPQSHSAISTTHPPPPPIGSPMFSLELPPPVTVTTPYPGQTTRNDSDDDTDSVQSSSTTTTTTVSAGVLSKNQIGWYRRSLVVQDQHQDPNQPSPTTSVWWPAVWFASIQQAHWYCLASFQQQEGAAEALDAWSTAALMEGLQQPPPSHVVASPTDSNQQNVVQTHLAQPGIPVVGFFVGTNQLELHCVPPNNNNNHKRKRSILVPWKDKALFAIQPKIPRSWLPSFSLALRQVATVMQYDHNTQTNHSSSHWVAAAPNPIVPPSGTNHQSHQGAPSVSPSVQSLSCRENPTGKSAVSVPPRSSHASVSSGETTTRLGRAHTTQTQQQPQQSSSTTRGGGGGEIPPQTARRVSHSLPVPSFETTSTTHQRSKATAPQEPRPSSSSSPPWHVTHQAVASVGAPSGPKPAPPRPRGLFPTSSLSPQEPPPHTQNPAATAAVPMAATAPPAVEEPSPSHDLPLPQDADDHSPPPPEMDNDSNVPQPQPQQASKVESLDPNTNPDYRPPLSQEWPMPRHACPWDQVWSLLEFAGWSVRRWTHPRTGAVKRAYLKPHCQLEASRPGVGYFTSLDDLQTFCQDEYDWQGPPLAAATVPQQQQTLSQAPHDEEEEYDGEHDDDEEDLEHEEEYKDDELVEREISRAQHASTVVSGMTWTTLQGDASSVPHHQDHDDEEEEQEHEPEEEEHEEEAPRTQSRAKSKPASTKTSKNQNHQNKRKNPKDSQASQKQASVGSQKAAPSKKRRRANQKPADQASSKKRRRNPSIRILRPHQAKELLRHIGIHPSQDQEEEEEWNLTLSSNDDKTMTEPLVLSSLSLTAVRKFLCQQGIPPHYEAAMSQRLDAKQIQQLTQWIQFANVAMTSQQVRQYVSLSSSEYQEPTHEELPQLLRDSCYEMFQSFWYLRGAPHGQHTKDVHFFDCRASFDKFRPAVRGDPESVVYTHPLWQPSKKGSTGIPKVAQKKIQSERRVLVWAATAPHKLPKFVLERAKDPRLVELYQSMEELSYNQADPNDHGQDDDDENGSMDQTSASQESSVSSATNSSADEATQPSATESKKSRQSTSSKPKKTKPRVIPWYEPRVPFSQVRPILEKLGYHQQVTGGTTTTATRQWTHSALQAHENLSFADERQLAQAILFCGVPVLPSKDGQKDDLLTQETMRRGRRRNQAATPTLDPLRHLSEEERSLLEKWLVFTYYPSTATEDMLNKLEGAVRKDEIQTKLLKAGFEVNGDRCYPPGSDEHKRSRANKLNRLVSAGGQDPFLYHKGERVRGFHELHGPQELVYYLLSTPSLDQSPSRRSKSQEEKADTSSDVETFLRLWAIRSALQRKEPLVLPSFSTTGVAWEFYLERVLGIYESSSSSSSDEESQASATKPSSSNIMEVESAHDASDSRLQGAVPSEHTTSMS